LTLNEEKYTLHPLSTFSKQTVVHGLFSSLSRKPFGIWKVLLKSAYF